MRSTTYVDHLANFPLVLTGEPGNCFGDWPYGVHPLWAAIRRGQEGPSYGQKRILWR